LESYGDRVQYSVFVIDAPPVILARRPRVHQVPVQEDPATVLVLDERGRLTEQGRGRLGRDRQGRLGRHDTHRSTLTTPD
jgi:CRISPR/Cas system-associated endoribonuclease Cas2